MNRRQFLTGATVLTVLAPSIPTSALDIDLVESPIMWMLRMLPDHPGPEGLDFPTTTGTNYLIQRSVWPENPDMYWDPVGEDYLTVFGFHPTAMSFGAGYEGTSLANLDNSVYDWESTLQALESNGWELVDDDLHILHYGGSDEDRSGLSGSLNELGSWMREGIWDWISLPDAAHLVSGPNEEPVGSIADRVKNYPAMTTIETNFHGLRNLLHPEAYYLTLVAPQVLSVANTRATYISKSWMGDTPIIQSIGLRLESPEHIEETLQAIRDRLNSEVSSMINTRFSDFLEIIDVAEYHASLRIDFVDTTGDWDIVHALEFDDLGMLPRTPMDR